LRATRPLAHSVGTFQGGSASATDMVHTGIDYGDRAWSISKRLEVVPSDFLFAVDPTPTDTSVVRTALRHSAMLQRDDSGPSFFSLLGETLIFNQSQDGNDTMTTTWQTMVSGNLEDGSAVFQTNTHIYDRITAETHEEEYQTYLSYTQTGKVPLSEFAPTTLYV